MPIFSILRCLNGGEIMKYIVGSILSFLAIFNLADAKAQGKPSYQYKKLDYALADSMNLDLDRIKENLEVKSEEVVVILYDENENPVDLSIFNELNFNEVRADLHQIN